MSVRRTWKHHLLAVALAIASLTLLRNASQSTGYVRDEAAYFAASLKIRDWLDLAVQDLSQAIERKDRYFRYNREHPTGIKLLGAIAATTQTKTTGEVPGQTLRWPAQLIAALGVYLLTLIATARYGAAIGVFCGASFIALPRVFFHAQLHCFDIAIAVAALAVSAAFLRFVKHPSKRNTLYLGVCFGLALSVKHNALLFPIFLLGALFWQLLRRKHQRDNWARLIGLGAAAIGIGALLFGLLWPWLWSDPWSRWIEYIAFHQDHSYYNMAFLGQNYNQPPLPIAYPWALTAATWPLCWISLVLFGFSLALRTQRHREQLAAHVDIIMALGPILLISLPSVPIFGGTKHWITAYPFCCLLMGRSLAALKERMQLDKNRWGNRLSYASLALLLSPAVIDTWRSHPHQLAQYAGWMGGPRAAARLGLGRAFWGSMCVPKALEKLKAPGELFTHDMHPYLLGAYRADGLARNIKSGRRKSSTWAFHFHEDHFLIDEQWTQRGGFGHAASWVCELDDVALMSLYRKNVPKPKE